MDKWVRDGRGRVSLLLYKFQFSFAHPCILSILSLQNLTLEAREIGNCGAIYLALGAERSALTCHNEFLAIAQDMRNNALMAHAHSHLGVVYHYLKNYEQVRLLITWPRVRHRPS